MKVLLLAIAVGLAAATPLQTVLTETLSGKELVDYVNKNQNDWVADPNHKYINKPLAQLRYLFGALPMPANGPQLKPAPPIDAPALEALPKNFDARQNWPECTKMIADVRDQSNCGSCWAIAATAAMSDRICIQSKGKKLINISTQDLMSCCHSCGFGCQGGFPGMAWQYYEEDGIVSGGDYHGEGCRPYPLAPCEHHTNGTHYPPCSPDIAPTPRCEKKCVASNTDYEKDRHYAKNSYYLPAGEERIMQEIYKNGPVEAAFTVYTDFLAYKSGIYHHTAGGVAGGHAVRVLGWGEDNGQKYWLIANSWNEDWGDQGLFKIRRGRDECGIESGMCAGLPKDA